MDEHQLQLINTLGWVGFGIASLVSFLKGFRKERRRTGEDLAALHERLQEEMRHALERKDGELEEMVKQVASLKAQVEATAALYQRALVSNQELRLENDALRTRVTRQESEIAGLQTRLRELEIRK